MCEKPDPKLTLCAFAFSSPINYPQPSKFKNNKFLTINHSGSFLKIGNFILYDGLYYLKK